MLHNAALPKLTNALLARIPFVSIPNNPRNMVEPVRPINYRFVSTTFVEKKDEAGVVHLLIQGTTCKRNPPKPKSKRDLHRYYGA